MTHSITSFVASHGIYAVFILMAVDAVFPAASELVMLYAGAVASGAVSHRHPTLFGSHLAFGADSYFGFAEAGTFGYLLGAIAGWSIGSAGGRPLLFSRGRWVQLTPERLDVAERWFSRHGDLAVFVGRLTPVIRSFISIPAGVFGVRLSRYTLLTLVGSAIWSFGFAAAGWGLGSGYERLHHQLGWAEIAVVACAVGAGAIVALGRRRVQV